MILVAASEGVLEDERPVSSAGAGAGYCFSSRNETGLYLSMTARAYLIPFFSAKPETATGLPHAPDVMYVGERLSTSVSVLDARKGNSELSTHVLVVDDQEVILELCSEVACSLGYRASAAVNGAEALDVVEREHVDVLMADLKMPGMNGMELLEKVKSRSPQTEVLIMTAYGSVPSAVQAMKLGACDYLTKPFNIEEVKLLLERTVQKANLVSENRSLREQVRSKNGYGELSGTAPSMQELFKMIVKVSQSHCPVLIAGESGTGKELVARAIHQSGPLREQPFLPVDCSALVPTLIESELFGYVRGAFTGALRTKQGLLEAAQGGTVFLDEIAEMPVDLQSKLLRALQEREVKPVGSTRAVKFDARIIAASNRDLESAIQQGVFRKDLYFRLNVVTLRLPPLRERKSDIPLLVNHFLDVFSGGQRRRQALSEEALNCLLAYDWPGNVRELENCIERAVALGSGPVLHVADLPTNLQNPQRAASAVPVGREPVVALPELERQAILRAVAEARGDKLLAARMLGIGKTTLYRKLNAYSSNNRNRWTP